MLECSRNAEANALFHRHYRKVPAEAGHASGIGKGKTGDHVEKGGLPGAVWPHQAVQASRTDLDRNALDRLQGAI